jgi:D-alanyl-D-alanine carboxypeptidase/D-alanyl-D-alanine-endopeptidase (penicillin-binding protein 4)
MIRGTVVRTIRRNFERMLRATVLAAPMVLLCVPAIAQSALAQDSSATAAPTTATPSLATQIATLLTPPDIARDHWGIAVTTLDGAPIYSLNDAQLFQPASNAKLFTTAAALALLGPDKTFETKVIGTLNAATGIVTGDLVIVGGGEANLSARQLPYVEPPVQPRPALPPPDPLRYLASMADQVAAKGVKSITGDIVGDDTYFPWEPYPEDWAIDDAVWGYGAPVSALSIADNQLRLTVPPGTITGPKGHETYRSSTPVLDQNGVPYYTVQSTVEVTTAKFPTAVQVERAPGSRVIRVYGQMVSNAVPDVEEIAIADPAEYAAIAFKQLLQARGIAVSGTARARHLPSRDPFSFVTALHAQGSCEAMTVAGGECAGDCAVLSHFGDVLATHRSEPLAQDVVLTNKESLNLHAELMLHHLGRRVTCGDGSTVVGARMVRAFLISAGLDPNDFLFFDGSGLSGHDLVTPRATAKLLTYAAHDPKTGAPQPWFADWKASRPIAGEDGTLASRFPKPPLKDHLFAKTGTLGEARALSGYLDCASGRTVIFSILVGNHLPGSNADRDAMDRIVAAIAAAE